METPCQSGRGGSLSQRQIAKALQSMDAFLDLGHATEIVGLEDRAGFCFWVRAGYREVSGYLFSKVVVSRRIPPEQYKTDADLYTFEELPVDASEPKRVSMMAVSDSEGRIGTVLSPRDSDCVPIYRALDKTVYAEGLTVKAARLLLAERQLVDVSGANLGFNDIAYRTALGVAPLSLPSAQYNQTYDMNQNRDF